MSPVSVLTTVFGAFCVTFVVIICWSRLVDDFGAIGGMMAAGIIVGTFWVMNHKLPGFGIHPEGIPQGQKLRMAAESVPRLAAAIAGGAVGGAIMGLVGWTGANLFGYR